MDDSIAFGGNAARLYNTIEKVVIVRGILDEDPIVWEIHLNGAVLKIPAEKLETQAVFRAQYIRTFNYPAPKVKMDEWDAIVELLASEKAEIAKDEEESNGIYIAKQIFEEIKKMPIDDDEDTAAIGKCLLKRDGLYYIISKKIEEMITTNSYKITANRLSPVMHKLGMKTKGTEIPYINNKRVRAWAFHPELIEKNRIMEQIKTHVSNIMEQTGTHEKSSCVPKKHYQYI